MKKIGMMFLTITLLLMMTSVAYAKDSEETRVWIESNSKEALDVTIETNGSVTDGVVVLTYDADQLNLTSEEAIKASEAILMYSVNVEEIGVLKISFISDETVTEEIGTLFTMNFGSEAELTEQGPEELIVFDEEHAYVHSTQGDALLGKADSEAEEPSTEEASTEGTDTEESSTSDATQEPNTEETTSDGSTTVIGDGTDTGDHNPVMALLASALVAIFIAIIGKIMRKENVK